MRWPPVSVILPAYNEAAAVASQVEAVARVLEAHGILHEIIVVDDGSSDATAERALSVGARVLQHPQNRGYGAAIKTAIRAAQHEALVIMDADGTYPADQIPLLLTQLDGADMVIGARLGRNPHVPRLRRLGKTLLRRLAMHITGRPIPDLNSGLRAFQRDCSLQYFPILSDRFSFTTTLTLALLSDDYRIVYHPIDYYPRIGRSNVSSRHFMDFAVLVLRMAMLFQPLKVFLPLAGVCGLLGVAKVVFDIIAFFPRHHTVGWPLLYEAVLSTSALLVLLVALQLLLVGMVADGVLRRIAQHHPPRAPSRAVGVVELRGSSLLEEPATLGRPNP